MKTQFDFECFFFLYIYVITTKHVQLSLIDTGLKCVRYHFPSLALQSSLIKSTTNRSFNQSLTHIFSRRWAFHVSLFVCYNYYCVRHNYSEPQKIPIPLAIYLPIARASPSYIQSQMCVCIGMVKNYESTYFSCYSVIGANAQKIITISS